MSMESFQQINRGGLHRLYSFVGTGALEFV